MSASGSRVSRDNYAKSRGARSEMQGSFEPVHFTICREENGMAVRINEGFLDQVRFKILLLLQVPKESTDSHAKEAPSPDPMSEVEGKLSRIEMARAPNLKAGHSV